MNVSVRISVKIRFGVRVSDSNRIKTRVMVRPKARVKLILMRVGLRAFFCRASESHRMGRERLW